MGLIDDIKSWTNRNGAPFTVVLIASFIISSLTLWLTHLKRVEHLFLSNHIPSQPWAFVTYPWAYMPLGDGLTLMFFLFLMYWLYQVGTSVEREIGSLKLAGLWFASTILAGVFMMGGGSLFKAHVDLFAPYLPESALTVVWCVRNRTTTILLYGFIPASGFWLGWSTVVISLLLYGAGAPVLGVLSCLHLGIAYLFASNRIPFLPYGASSFGYVIGERRDPKRKEATTRGQVQYDQSYFDEVKRRETERAEQERLRRLFGDEEK